MNANEIAMVRRLLTPQAWERLVRITTEYPDLKESIEKSLLSLARVAARDSRTA